MKVFISYSSKNRDICRTIAALLERIEGVEVWFDKGLIPGDVYSKTIAEKLDETDIVAALISGDSVKSEWVKDELAFAKDKHKKIIPIWIEHTELPVDLDLLLHRFHSLFWYLRHSDEAFLQELRGSVGAKKDVSDEMFEGFGNEFSEQENERIRHCLEMEKQERFSYCYEKENALLLGKAYLFGGLVEADMERSCFYLKVAEYFGSMDASCFLLQLELEKLPEDAENDRFVPYIEKMKGMADQGSIIAKMFLGNAYWYGKYGLEVSYEISAGLYEECAKAGNARAQYMMASNYYEGDGVVRDYDLAIMYANLALEQKYQKAWRRWGKFYRDGRAVKQDFEKAKQAYERGVSWGDFNCCNKIGDMYYYGWGFTVDYQKAVSYYEKALTAPMMGHRYALRKAHAALAICYETGNGVEKSLEAAAEHYRQAYNLGDNEARKKYLALAELAASNRDQT